MQGLCCDTQVLDCRAAVGRHTWVLLQSEGLRCPETRIMPRCEQLNGVENVLASFKTPDLASCGAIRATCLNVRLSSISFRTPQLPWTRTSTGTSSGSSSCTKAYTRPDSGQGPQLNFTQDKKHVDGIKVSLNRSCPESGDATRGLVTQSVD